MGIDREEFKVSAWSTQLSEVKKKRIGTKRGDIEECQGGIEGKVWWFGNQGKKVYEGEENQSQILLMGGVIWRWSKVTLMGIVLME